MNGGMKKGDVSREMQRISIVLDGCVFFSFFLCRDKARGGVIR